MDCHAHAGCDAWKILSGGYPTVQSVADLLRKMDANGVHACVVFPTPFDMFETDLAELVLSGDLVASATPLQSHPYELTNAALLREVSLWAPDRMLPFAAIWPGRKESEQVAMLQSCVSQGVLFGLKFHGVATGAGIDTLGRSQFLGLAEQCNLPILVHTAQDERLSALALLDVAERHPGVRFCAAHAGGLSAALITRLSDSCPQNFFVDCSPLAVLVELGESEIAAPLFERSLDRLSELYLAVPNALLWGTDEPWSQVSVTDPRSSGVRLVGLEYESCWRLLAAAGSRTRDAVARVNPMRFLFG